MQPQPDIGFIDIHHHILYGVDDGPKTRNDAFAMLQLAYEDGTRHIVVTSHFNPSGHCPDMDMIQSQMIELNALCREHFPGLSISLGGELLFSDGAVRLLRKGHIPTINDTSYLLVEFQTRITPDLFEDAIRHLTNAGYNVIVAHTERYGEIFGDIKRMQFYKDKYSVLYQVNAEIFLDKQAFFFRRKINKVIQASLIDFVASDAHSTKWRRTRLRQCYDTISKKYGQELANYLLRDSAAYHLKIRI